MAIAKYMWSPFVLRLMGVKLKISGLDHIDAQKSYVIMANHNSFIDIPVLFKTMPFYAYFIAKQELKKIPLLGWYIQASGMIFIDRSNRQKSIVSIAKAGKLIENGKVVIIFPEGTKSRDGNVGPFKKGGFHLAAQSNTAILPVRIEGANKVWPNRKSFQMRRGNIRVSIGKPIQPNALEKLTIDEQVNLVRNTILHL